MVSLRLQIVLDGDRQMLFVFDDEDVVHREGVRG
jgi:hypothetical protein